MLITLIAAAPVVGSRLQRIVGDEAGQLDEMELQLRHLATSRAYLAFTAAAVLGVAYCGFATNAGLWRPNLFEHWNGLFWGLFLYASLLPTAILAWTLPAEAEG